MTPRVLPGEGSGWRLIAAVTFVSLLWGVTVGLVLYRGLGWIENRR